MDLEIFQEVQVSGNIEAQRKRVVDKITLESDKLVDELLKIIYNDDVNVEGDLIVDAKVKLSAIAMLLDRGIPKLAVDNSKSQVVEETGTRKKIREEIEAMFKKQSELEQGK